MSQLNNNTSTGKWEATIDITKQSGSHLIPATAGTYVDKDIDFTINVQQGTAASKTSLGYGESTTVGGGWVDSTTITNGIGAGTVTASSPTITPSISSTRNTDGTYSISGSGTSSISVGTAGYISSTVGTKNSGTPKVSGSVAGSTINDSDDSTATITPSAEDQDVTIGAGYYPTVRTVTVKAASSGDAASIEASATDPGTSYTKKDVTLASGGYLKIDAGYIGNTKLSLADLVPDGADIPASESSPYILTGHSAYDNDGNLITGGINDGTITNNTSGGTSSGTINRGSQIKIGEGYYGADVYYTAQANSGTKTISGSGTTSVDGYANASVAAAATPALTIIDSTSTITPATVSGDSTVYNITTSVTGKTSYGTAGWIAKDGLATATDSSATVGRIIAGSITNGATIPSGSSSTDTIDRGKVIKIGAGWYPSDLYYTAQADAHSSYTPSSTYFQTSTSGAVTAAAITANKYATSTYYVKAGSAGVTASQSITANPTISYDSTNKKYVASYSGSKDITGTVSTKGWIESVSSATVTTSGSLDIAEAGKPTIGLVSTTDTTTYPSGYSALRATVAAGYNANSQYNDYSVYQGSYTLS